ncbi:Uncharacterised protein [Klebsiella oxytoca]|nr:Uncharacterised protein [Klebsiella oxytoca]SBK90792.1 Uncharacterised protein [Klebsiella oxytoca]SBL25854.1 Uncharacterised protein [Klebsiella oxytoca]SBL48376.1 Uncharacterised protein [Klebsiella oxytoca]
MLFLAITVAKIHHQLFRQVELCQRFSGGGDVGSVVIRFFTTAHNNMAVRIPAGLIDGHLALLIRRQEHMAGAGSADGINGDTGITIGTVFKAHRA